MPWMVAGQLGRSLDHPRRMLRGWHETEKSTGTTGFEPWVSLLPWNLCSLNFIMGDPTRKIKLSAPLFGSAAASCRQGCTRARR